MKAIQLGCAFKKRIQALEVLVPVVKILQSEVTCTKHLGNIMDITL